MLPFPPLLALFCGILPVSAQELKDSQVCAESISSAVGLLSFLSPDSMSNPCTNRLRTYSIYAAIKSYCPEPEIIPGLRHINQDCNGEYSRPPYADIEPDITDSYLESLRVVDFREVPADEELKTVVLISRTYFDIYYKTIKEWSVQTGTHRLYGYSTYWFWGIILAIGFLNRICDLVFGFQRGRHNPDIETHFQHTLKNNKRCCSPVKRIYHWVRTHFIIPAAFGSRHQQLVWWCTVPTRLVTIVVISYFTLSLVLCLSSYNNLFIGNAYYNEPTSQFWRYFSDRTGVLSYTNLPLLWLFGGRNNVFLWATGWSFSTFNVFHRATARVATIQAIAHSIGYTILTVRQGTYSHYWHDAWWYMGVVATINMALLLGFSSIWLRRHYYEIFLITHITLSISTLTGLFVHTNIFLGKYEPYLWPVVAIWCFDRLARLVRLLFCNTYIYRNRQYILTTKSTISYNKGTDIIRLDVIPGSPALLPAPGQHYYLYQPRKWRGYESHPFTLGSWTAIDKAGTETSNGSQHSYDISLPRTLADGKSNEVPSCYKFTFWIRPFDGWTRRLRDDCLKEADKMILNANFLIEGPYGIRAPVYNYENTIFLAGGTGIAAILPYIQELIRRSSTADESSEHQNHIPSPASSSSASILSPPSLDKSSSSTFFSSNTEQSHLRSRKITLIWTTRQSAFIHDLVSRELKPILQASHGSLTIEAKFYSTEHINTETPLSQQTLLPINKDTVNPTESTWLLSPNRPSDDGFQAIDIQEGRPDIKQSILSAIDDDGSRSAVMVCGPASMADSARGAVHHALKGGARDVDYFEETFGW